MIKWAYAASQSTVLHMKRLNQTEYPIFVILCVLCFQRRSCLTLILKRRFRGSRIVIITNIVVVSSVGIKRVICLRLGHLSGIVFFF